MIILLLYAIKEPALAIESGGLFLYKYEMNQGISAFFAIAHAVLPQKIVHVNRRL